MKANIFNIQRYSIHDGPGIRTVVFLKGCPLRCLWCSNPESQAEFIELEYHASLCEHCARCIAACPRDAVNADPYSTPQNKIDHSKCDLCGECVRVCPSGALRFVGKEMTLDQVFEEILKDITFYRKSGGGVTLSGGEPFFQPEFSLALLERCFHRNIHTAVETCGQVDWEFLQRALPFTNLFLFDLKHLDSARHHDYSGVPNDLILENLARLAENRAAIILRIPLLQDFNLEKNHLQEIGKLAVELKIPEIHLLPFHQFGRDKYTQLGRSYTLADQEGLEDSLHGRALIEQAVSWLSQPGLKIQVGG